MCIMVIRDRKLYCPRIVTLITLILLRGFETRGTHVFAFSFSCLRNIGMTSCRLMVHHTASGFERGSSATSLQRTCGLDKNMFRLSFGTSTRNSMEMNMCANSVSSSASFSSDLTSILRKTLLSVEECIQIYAANAERKKNEDKEGNRSEPIIFVDASWWHKGEYSGPGRGREM